jgi:Zn-dependent protease with chaperone function
MLQSDRWADALAQAVFHTLVASLVVEALARSWGVTEPGQRMTLRRVALWYPLVLLPAMLLLFPQRADEPFQDVALVVGRRWQELRPLGLDPFLLFVGGLAGLGLLLFLMDLLPLLRALARRRPVPVAPDPESGARLAAASAALAEAAGSPPPPIRFLDRDQPVLFCAGVRSPGVVVSRGALRLLDEAELRAALAHEWSHLRRHDPARSWGVMALRALMCLNPAFQVVSRALARDAERLADERAALVCGDRLALASGLIKLHRATGGGGVLRTLPFAGALAEPLRRARSFDVEQRARALLDEPPRPLPFGPARVALAASAVSALLFFVV